jgi:hypothetical protein
LFTYDDRDEGTLTLKIKLLKVEFFGLTWALPFRNRATTETLFRAPKGIHKEILFGAFSEHPQKLIWSGLYQSVHTPLTTSNGDIPPTHFNNVVDSKGDP